MEGQEQQQGELGGALQPVVLFEVRRRLIGDGGRSKSLCTRGIGWGMITKLLFVFRTCTYLVRRCYWGKGGGRDGKLSGKFNHKVCQCEAGMYSQQQRLEPVSYMALC